MPNVPEAKGGSPAAREPRQARGRRRMDAILDAASALIEEVGASAVTVQAIADRAGASKGSMYHFFPDRESVFLALAERHVEALRGALAGARGEETRAAAAESAEGAVEAFLRPLLGYLDRHPDLRRMMTEPASLERLAAQRAALNALVEEHAGWVARARLPRLGVAEAPLVAATMAAVLSAMRSDRVAAGARSPEAARREMRRLLRAYLASYAGEEPNGESGV